MRGKAGEDIQRSNRSMIKDRIRQEQLIYIMREKKRYRKKWEISLICLIVLSILFVGYGRYAENCFEITCYYLETSKLQRDISIALLSDLHNHEYGEDNYELTEAIRKLQPDLIIMAGDMVDYHEIDVSVILTLCDDLKRVAPIYYVLGNHEGVMIYANDGGNVPLDMYLLQKGIHILYQGRMDVDTVGGTVSLGGFSVPEEETEFIDKQKLREFENSDNYKIIVSHFPSVFYEYLYDGDFDLALAGHYHGGMIRIPGMGGIYHTEDGFFPRYSGGEYQLGKGILIVSRGLGDHTVIPRINNSPELVMVEIESVNTES